MSRAAIYGVVSVLVGGIGLFLFWHTAKAPTTIGTPQPTGVNIPLARAPERVTKKPFGIYVTPRNSPVQPERFSGFHTGTDFELLPGEQAHAVLVRAVCDGVLLQARNASGYGGVAVQSCTIDGGPVTVVYGHLELASVRAKAGMPVHAGDVLGNLGTPYSSETDGERAHLHLGIHHGDAIDIRGYVSARTDLAGWIDPMTVIGR